jgi:hypothetical protein
LLALYQGRQPGAFDRTAELDRFSRLLVGGEKRLIAGGAESWLYLVAHGYVWSPLPGRLALTGLAEELILDHLKKSGSERVGI